MKSASKAVLALALFGAASLAHAAPNCVVQLKGNDAMQFDLKTATVSASCPKITIELVHTGKMAAQVMGHNVVITGLRPGEKVHEELAGPEEVVIRTSLDRVFLVQMTNGFARLPRGLSQALSNGDLPSIERHVLSGMREVDLPTTVAS